jgi:hypothetical protein
MVSLLFKALRAGAAYHYLSELLVCEHLSTLKQNVSHFELLHVHWRADRFYVFGQVCIQFFDINVGANFAILSANLLGLAFTGH